MVEPAEFLSLRGRYRKLKKRSLGFAKKRRRDRSIAELGTTLSGDAVRFPKRLAQKLKKISRADGLSLFTVAESSGRLSVRAAEGDITETMRESSILLGVEEAANTVRGSSKCFPLSSEDDANVHNVVLMHFEKTVGLVSIRCANRSQLEKSAKIVEELAPFVAELIHDCGQKTILDARLRRAKSLGEISSAISGVESRDALTSTTISQLSEIFELEHISISWLSEEGVTLAASHGTYTHPLRGMSFARGVGLAGWLRVGAPEIVASDVAEDARCIQSEMKRLRIRSLAVIPIGVADETQGYISVASPRSMAVDVATIEALRFVAAEMRHALQRIDGESRNAAGPILLSGFNAQI